MAERPPIMVLVTLQQLCARLIRNGADMAMKQRCPLKVVHVALSDQAEKGNSAIDAQVLNDLYALSNEVGAEMCVLTAEVAVAAMADYAQKNGVKQILLGGGQRAHGIAETLSSLLPGVKVLIIDPE